MKTGRRWVVVDTETDGLNDPIHVVEIAAQLMEGWEPVGSPFQMFLNHDVPIPPEAVAIHGYTRAFLRENGHPPDHVHAAFRDYARDYPLVAHNLSFDWNRCLTREWQRLGLAPIGQRGFCCMMLARRLAPEPHSYRLDALKDFFQLPASQSHRASNDVHTIVELFRRVYMPRLQSAGLDTFDSVATFAKQTPIAKCHDLIQINGHPKQSQQSAQDAWYYIDAAQKDHGPLSARQIQAEAGMAAFYVWRQGLPDWVVNQECPEFLALAATPPPVPVAPSTDPSKTTTELLGLCRGILADGKVTTSEVLFLQKWLQNAGGLNEWPATEISHSLERILDDGKVTTAEKNELKRLLMRATDSTAPAVEVTTGTRAEESQQPTPQVVELPFYLIELEQGTNEWHEWRYGGIGASDAPVIMGENPWKTVNELFDVKRSRSTDFSQNEAMRRGTELEPEARARYIAMTGKEMRPACLQSRVIPWLRASVDGLASDGFSAVEIKCGNSVYRKTAASRSVPSYYYGQLQHILAVTGLPSIDFFCYLPRCPEVLITVQRDDTYIERMLTAEQRFWEQLQTGARM